MKSISSFTEMLIQKQLKKLTLGGFNIKVSLNGRKEEAAQASVGPFRSQKLTKLNHEYEFKTTTVQKCIKVNGKSVKWIDCKSF